jgi:hypothetical protein
VLRIYFDGHNQDGFFPITAYLRFIELYALHINDDRVPNYRNLDNSIREFFKSILKHVEKKYSKLDRESQLKLTVSTIDLLTNLIDRCQKEYEMITTVIELILKSIFIYNKQTDELARDQNRSQILRRSSSIIYNNENISGSSMQTNPYKKLIDLIHNWLLNRECDESLLINYGLDERQPAYTNLIRNDELNPNIMLQAGQRQRIEGTVNEFQLYNLMLKIIKSNEMNYTSQQRHNHHHHHHQDLLTSRNIFESFQSDLFKLFKERCRSRLEPNGFNELIEFRSRFDFNKFNQNSYKFQTIFDDLIVDRLNKKASVKEFNDMCKKLFNMKKDVLKFYIDKLLNEIWPKQNDQWFNFLLTSKTVLTIYENQINFKALNGNPLSLTHITSYEESNYLLNFAYNSKFIQIFHYSIDILNRISSGNAIINDIEMAYRNLDQTKKLIKLLSDNLVHLNRKLEFDNFERLIAIRLAEVNELGK